MIGGPSPAAAAIATARQRLAQRLGAALQQVPPHAPLAVAVSGGPDSMVLAALATEAAAASGHALVLFHVHHGLQASADDWTAAVLAFAARLDVPCEVRHVEVGVRAGEGLEAAARLARYAALADMARAAGVGHVLIAHHLDDQAETVLMRLLRGAGLTGVAGMRERAERDGIVYLRPWLDVERAVILTVAAGMDAEFADDPSNCDPRYARGALRARVLPALAGHWPGYRQTLGRFARLAAEAGNIIADVAADDLAALTRTHPGYGRTLDLARWRQLTRARRALALRTWLADQHIPMPSEARLAQLCHQLASAAPDRQVLLRHADVRIRVHRGLVLLDRSLDVPAGGEAPASVTLSWQGEASLAVPALGGTLYFEPAAGGLDAGWLRGGELRIGLRRGRERLRPDADGPSRSLKNLYQEAGIPAWERPRLPLVWRGPALVYAAGLGADARAPRAAHGVGLRWQADSPGATAGRE